jgi:hypothetical protein
VPVEIKLLGNRCMPRAKSSARPPQGLRWAPRRGRRAWPSEVLVSYTVKDLVAGSRLSLHQGLVYPGWNGDLGWCLHDGLDAGRIMTRKSLSPLRTMLL